MSHARGRLGKKHLTHGPSDSALIPMLLTQVCQCLITVFVVKGISWGCNLDQVSSRDVPATRQGRVNVCLCMWGRAGGGTGLYFSLVIIGRRMGILIFSLAAVGQKEEPRVFSPYNCLQKLREGKGSGGGRQYISITLSIA